MQDSVNIITHTRKLLQNGIFSHLTDECLSVLHHMILKGEINSNSKKRFFDIWHRGNFSEEFLHIRLLQETNYILQTNGENIIEENFLEVA